MLRSSRSLLSRTNLVAFALLAVALALRLWDIRARSLWFDEAGEFWIATAAMGRIAGAVQTGSGDPPLYSFLLHVWMNAGTGILWLRLPSVGFSVLGILGVLTFARRLGGWKAALAAGSLMAILPPDIRYAQEAGQYALMLGAVAWNLVALHGFSTTPSRRHALVWAASALVASYSYYGAVIAVAVPFACVVIEHARRRDRATLRADAVAAGTYGIGVVPLVVFLRLQLSRVLAGSVSSAGPGGLLSSGIEAPWTWIREVLAFQFTGWPFTRVPSGVPVACALVLLIVAARARRRVAVWLAATWAVCTLADAIDVFPYGFRWGLVLTPLLVSLTASGLSMARSRLVAVVATVAFAGLVAGAVVSLPNRSLRDGLYPGNDWPWPETEDMGTVAAYWREHRSAAQPTYVYYGAAPAFAYYVRDELVTTDLPPTWYLECWHADAAYCDNGNIHFGPWMRSRNETQRLTDVFKSIGGRPDAFWVVFSHMQPNDDRDLVASIIASGYRIESVCQATGTAVFLFTRQ
jgi:hypothetical protein